MKKITFLGPVGATFSHDAYNILAEMFGTPKVIIEGEQANCIPALSNGEVLKLILEHSGYGAIAMETLAEGRVTEPLESFIDLLKTYWKTDICPIRIIGAIKLKLHICLMTRYEVPLDLVREIIAHPKALGVCRRRITSMKKIKTIINASSNGDAARLVADGRYTGSDHVFCAALGPRSAAEKYKLRIHDRAFEDGDAVTTFFLLGPKGHPVVTGEENRLLIVFKLKNEPGSLYRLLGLFDRERLNLIRIHSVDIDNCTCSFVIEVEVGRSQLRAIKRVMERIGQYVEIYLFFGPFKVLER